MRWSIPIASVGGTEVRLHLNFLLFLGWIGMAAWVGGGAQAALGSVGFIALLFLCILLHEFGHILAARAFGVRTPDVTLLPIGGVSRLERMPEKPHQELLMALAGPAVSLAIAAALMLWLGGLPAIETLGTPASGNALVAQLAFANLTLGLFNLLPAFPMDGGRVLRALLAARLGFTRGTRIAATIGEGTAILFAFVGLLAGHPILLFIALFIYIAAAGESGVALMRDALRGLKTREVMVTRFVQLAPGASLDEAAEALMRTSEREFPMAVAGAWRLVTRDAILAALRQHGREGRIGEAATQPLACIAEAAPAEAAMRLLEGGEPAVGVVDAGGELAGLVTWENLSEQLLIAQATQRRQARPFGSRAARV